MTALSPAELEARRAGRLDQRCRDCGFMSAASSWCCGCGGRNLEYRVHVGTGVKPGEAGGERVLQWCQMANEPRPADPERRARALAQRAPGYVSKAARKAAPRCPDTP